MFLISGELNLLECKPSVNVVDRPPGWFVVQLVSDRPRGTNLTALVGTLTDRTGESGLSLQWIRVVTRRLVDTLIWLHDRNMGHRNLQVRFCPIYSTSTDFRFRIPTFFNLYSINCLNKYYRVEPTSLRYPSPKQAVSKLPVASLVVTLGTFKSWVVVMLTSSHHDVSLSPNGWTEMRWEEGFQKLTL